MEHDLDLGDLLRRWRLERMLRGEGDLHDLCESEGDPAGIRCDTEWCNAFRDWAADCGDRQGDYTGLVHRNRAWRAEARDAGQPYEHGRLYYDERFDEAPSD